MAKSIKRVANIITDRDTIEYFASLKDDDITMTFMMETFGMFNDKRKYNPYDIITVPAGSYKTYDMSGKEKKNKDPFTTTVGKMVFNRYFIAPHPGIFDIFGYVNDNINKKTYEKMFDKMGYAVMEDYLTLDEYKTFCEKTQKNMPFISILAPNHTDAMLTVSKEIGKRKDALLKQHKAEIDVGDENAAKIIASIEKELLDYARELLKDDPSMDMFDSGAGGSFDNNFKNMFVMRGSVKNPDPNALKAYNIITSNYIDGCKPEEYVLMANTLAAGPYARSKKTALGGYWEKLFMSAFQHITLLEEGSDCGTKRYVTETLTDSNIESWMYSYIIQGDKLVELTSKNMGTFIGKKVKIRYSSLCEAKDGHCCSKCAGNLFYREGIQNVGAATPQIPSRLKLLSMKLFHEDQTKFIEMDPMRAFGLTD